MPRLRKRFVIDADVARACSLADKPDPRPGRCARLLEWLRDICYRMVLTEPLRAEWRLHRSTFFREWRDSMVARKSKKVAPTDGKLRADLCAGVLATALSEADREELAKDLHLLGAALATDGIIVSCDEAARKRFTHAASRVTQLRHIMWINPDLMDPDEIESWLRAGARPRKALLLGGGER
ncbi:MAG: hypothetical protein FJX74_13535 [Armatimonadetes bacterium]|nr:hypothetical protein [Armatimonadota bacterium]